MSTIILIGFKMSGKTTIGRALASATNRRFVDVDDMMVMAHEAENGNRRAPFEIYRDLGTDEYNRFERNAVVALGGIKNAVISTAGSTALFGDNVIRLRALGMLVMINPSRNVIHERWFADRLPEFVNPADPAGSFDAIYAKRESIYRSAADLCIATEGRDVEALVRLLIEVEGLNSRH